LLDTSVVIDLDHIPADALPIWVAQEKVLPGMRGN
jgi:hypothetical protein